MLARNASERNNVEVDMGYDTDSIAIFEIDKSFTDYLLCQICFSKCPLRQSPMPVLLEQKFAVLTSGSSVCL